MQWLTQKHIQLWHELLKSKRIGLKGDNAIPFFPFLKNEFPDIAGRAYVFLSWMSDNPSILSVCLNEDHRNCFDGTAELTQDLAILLTQAVRRGRGHYHCTDCGLKVRHPGPSDCCGAHVEVRS
jgi:hypothetical protein